ncbi:MAG: SDR family oxidoreductase [Bacteroidales bacterium]|nr:SDR family oxidoreductase [Bacteroidales bacterium]
MKFADIKIGDKATVKHTITDKDIEKFVDLTGDDNKLHVNKEFARNTEFKHPVVHGMLGVSFISTVIGTKLPGDGALWFSQTIDFLRPARVGDTITVTGEVLSKNENTKIIELKTEILNQYKQVVTTGIAKVKMVEQEKSLKTTKAENKENDEKAIIVLGATGGIGKATALKLAKDGFNIIIHYHTNKDVAEEIKKQVQKIGRKAIIHQADLLDISSIDVFLEAIRRSFSSIYGLVNCSTVKVPAIKFLNLEWHYFQDHFDINIKSSFYLLQKVLPIMETNKSGKIVFITTQAIESPNAEWLPYITAKAALNGFTKALAIEFAPKGITFNMVSPGMTDTDLLSEIPQKVKMLTEARTPLRRLCMPEDVANCIAFLFSHSADFITGETIRVNGGQVML